MYHLALATLFYFAYAICVYHDPIRRSSWSLWIVPILAMCAHLIWIHLAKSIDDNDDIFVWGMVWGGLIQIPWTIVPVIFGVRPNVYVWSGAALIVGGATLLKIGFK
jgi:hypothetical protein